MNLIDFINKYIKTGVDFDGVYGCQCVDLFRQYCADVLEVGHTGSVNGAKELFTKYEFLRGQISEREVFMRLAYPEHNLLKMGDVAVWDSTSANIYGHVAIVVQDMLDSVLVFEQNGFKQDGAKLTIRKKENLLGILRKWEV